MYQPNPIYPNSQAQQQQPHQAPVAQPPGQMAANQAPGSVAPGMAYHHQQQQQPQQMQHSYAAHQQQAMQPSQQPTMPLHQMPFIQQQQQLYQQQQFQHQQQLLAARDDSLQKLKRLDDINAAISKMSLTLIQFFEEISKDRVPPPKLKKTKEIFEEALKQLKRVETDLLTEIGHINMASTGHPHEGSIYGARKDYDLSRMQVHLIANQLNSLRVSLESPIQAGEFYEE